MTLPPSSPLVDPERLFALDRLDLLDTPPEPSYERLTRLVAKLLDAPVALVSLVTNERQFFKSQIGLPEPWASARETPLSHSFCQYVVTTNAPLVTSDAREDDLLRDNLAIPDLGVIAYAGMPLRAPDGSVLGSFCAIDTKPRVWTEDELAILEDLSEAVMSEIALRDKIHALQEIEAERSALQDELLLGQRSLLRELAFPMIPAMDNVVVIPVYGTLDELRRERLAAVIGEALQSARTVVLDLAGVARVSQEFVRLLEKMAQAAHAQGSTLVLSSVTPARRRHLEQHGTDLEAFRIYATLVASFSEPSFSDR